MSAQVANVQNGEAHVADAKAVHEARQGAATKETSYREAVRYAMTEAMEADDRVFLMGEDVGAYGGCYAVSMGMFERFGPERIRDTPLSESAFVGAGIGAAMAGMRPIVEVMTVNFSLLALDQIMNTAATVLHMSGGQCNVPIVIRMATGAGRQLAAQHSHSLEGWYAHIPGLRILAPATIEDARGMLAPALADPDPVLIFENAALYNLKAPLADPPPTVDIASAVVRRAGSDVSLITYGGSLFKTLEAAEALAQDGIEAEVLDLRVLRPLDTEAILATVRKTHHAVIVDEGWRTGSLAAEVSARIVEGAFFDLDAPPARVCSEEVPIPYAKHMEYAALPQPEKVVAAVKALLGRGGEAMAEFRMPSLGADMDAGRLLEWYVKPGDAVHRGDIVALVDTDKAAIEVEIFDEGVVGELLIEPGTTVPVGTAMARIEGEGAPRPTEAAVAAEEAGTAPVEVPAAVTPVAAPPAEAPASVTPAGVVPAAAAAPAAAPLRATPSARAHARELDLDLADVRGTGRHGLITHADVIAAGRLRERPVAEAAPAPAPPAPAVAPVPGPAGERSRLSPRARRLAEELGVDPSTLRGTGPDGTVTGDDVAAAGRAAGAAVGAAPGAPAKAPAGTPAAPAPREAPAAPARPAAGREKPSPERYAAMRRAIAAAMAKSKREIPHYYLTQPIDLERALTWLEARNLERPITERVLPAALLLRATVQAIAEVPEMNGFFREDGFEPSAAVHLGVGISLRQGGLIAPAILNAQDQDLLALMASIKDLVARTRTLQLRSSEMSEATITVTALGDQGVESVYGVIYPPQVALVGFGKVVARPWAVDGLLGVRHIVQATLAADHRASDGHTGGLFLAAIDQRLQHPEEL